jgi:hypothetical protein
VKSSKISKVAATALTDELTLTDKELTARVFAPERPRLEEARSAVEGVEDAAEAWEMLAARGLIPAEWMGDGERVFADDGPPPALADRGFSGHPTHAAVLRYLSEGPLLCDGPPTVLAAWTLGSDVAGMTTAERVAREAVRLLAPWGAPQPSRVCWRIVDPAEWDTQPGDYRHMPAAVAVGCSFVATPTVERAILRAKNYDFGTPKWRAAFTWECAAQWRYLARTRNLIAAKSSEVAERLAQGGYPPIPKELSIKAFSEIESPFDPLLSLWASGYALDAITEHVIVIAAPGIATKTRAKPMSKQR